MPETDHEDRTEEATPKRREEARKKGQAPRSRDFTTFVLLMTCSFVLLFTAKYIASIMIAESHHHLVLSREEIFNPEAMFIHLRLALLAGLKILSPIFIFSMVSIIAASIIMSGWNYSTENLGFKFERINPLSGLKKIISKRSLVELIKSCVKFLIVCVVALFYLNLSLPNILNLSNASLEGALIEGLSTVIWGFIFVTAGMCVVLFIDVPFQWYEYLQQLRMTKQEIRDEYKETEGSPEVKRRIRQVQYEISNRKMMQLLPTADVVITNPTHYAVALRYDDAKGGAPIVVAKGVDLMAEQIRRIAGEYEITLVSAPPLARSLYYHTEVEQEIPVGLYVAVAQVLAYVYQLKRYQRGETVENPSLSENLPIPEDLVR
jgi:flagellar biosynthetic protein FlhB